MSKIEIISVGDIYHFDKEYLILNLYNRIGCKKTPGKLDPQKTINLIKSPLPRKDLHQHRYGKASFNNEIFFLKFLSNNHFKKSYNNYATLKKYDDTNLLAESLFDEKNNIIIQKSYPYTINQKKIEKKYVKINLNKILILLENINKSEDIQAKNCIDYFDLCPTNFMLNQETELFIVDFGLWPHKTSKDRWNKIENIIKNDL